MAMNSTRFKSVFNSLPAVVQKVYGGVPANGVWDASRIHQELQRQGVSRDINNTRGCLSHLVDVRLVAEPTRGHFTRAQVRGPVAAEKKVFEQQEPQMATPSTLTMVAAQQPKADPIDALTKLSARVMVMSGHLKELANDIETAALDITEQMTVVDENTAKLKQLQTILKGLV